MDKEKYEKLLAEKDKEIAELYTMCLKQAKTIKEYQDAAATEREACAKVCDEAGDKSSSDHEAGGMYWCAAAIRARNNNA